MRTKAGFYKRKSNKRFYQLNYRIKPEKLRVIDTQGKQIGVFRKREALKIAQDKGLDLILVAPKAEPPVAKIADFKKFLYQLDKKEKEAKKGAKKSVAKDIKLSLFIAEADLSRLVKKSLEFLNQGYQVRLNLPLKGREIVKKERGFKLMTDFINRLGEVTISKKPRLEGRIIRAVVSSKK